MAAVAGISNVDRIRIHGCQGGFRDKIPSMRTSSILSAGVLAGIIVVSGIWVLAQSPNDPVEPPTTPTRPMPEKESNESEEEPAGRDFLPKGKGPWGLKEDVLKQMAMRARVYHQYALRFTCLETVRLAHYDSSNEASKEEVKRYDYILVRQSEDLKEFRRKVKRSGKVVPQESMEDQDAFPPAYGWAFLFSEFHQPYFAYRDLGDHFEGFDWVRVIQFKGVLPWSNGKDIREWEGVAIVDASSFTPLEIRAEPSDQEERIRAKFERWARSFNLMGFRLGPKPLGYRCRVQFGERRDDLTFPTDLRYDTFRAISATRDVPIVASIHQYDDYEFFKSEVTEEVGEPVGSED